MPGIIAEYARGIESVCSPRELQEILHKATLDSELFSEIDIKVRLTPFDHYMVGGKVGPFVHVTCYILTGRTQDQKKALTHLVMNRLLDRLGTDLSVTVDVRDMVRETYAKHAG